MSTKKTKTKLEGAREVLRALLDARDGPFYLLWVDLTDVLWSRLPDALRTAAGLPNIEFRIYGGGDDQEATYTAVGVSGRRMDGVGLSWIVALRTGAEQMEITGAAEIEEGQSSRELFSVTERTGDTTRAAELIKSIAAQVCARREGLKLQAAG
jgi:hypothetical protein